SPGRTWRGFSQTDHTPSTVCADPFFPYNCSKRVEACSPALAISSTAADSRVGPAAFGALAPAPLNLTSNSYFRLGRQLCLSQIWYLTTPAIETFSPLTPD